MVKWLALPVLGLACLLTAGAEARTGDVNASLAAEARQHGSVPVIVMLKTPRTARASGWQNLSDYIADVQQRALNEVGPQNINDVLRYRHTPAMAMRVDARALSALESASSVAAVYPNELRKASLANSTRVIEAQRSWSFGYTGAGQAVAVLDTGVDARHPFFSGRVVEEACFSTSGALGQYQARTLCVSGRDRASGPGAAAPCADACSHGTHVAGIVAGNGREFAGVAPEAGILAAQVFTEIEGMGVVALDSDIIAALEWVYENSSRYNIAAINMSLGGGRSEGYCDAESPYTPIIELLARDGIATVIASGNEYFTDAIAHPACISAAVSVGATDGRGGVTDFSNGDTELDLLAPGSNAMNTTRGVGIESAVPGNGFARMPGTSMAAPHVAGAFAVIREAFPQATVSQIVTALKATGVDVRDARNNITTPRIAVHSAIEFLASEFGSAAEDEAVPAPKPNPDEPPSADQPGEPKEKRVGGVLIIDKKGS